MRVKLNLVRWGGGGGAKISKQYLKRFSILGTILPCVRGPKIPLDSCFNPPPPQQTLILATTLEGEGVVSE